METQLTITMGDMVDFVMFNRRGNAFKDYTPEQVFTVLEQALRDECLFYCSDVNTGKIIGVACGKKLEGNVMLVRHILTTQPGILRIFFHMFREKFPFHSLMQAERHKKFRYNVTYKNLTRFGHLLNVLK